MWPGPEPKLQAICRLTFQTATCSSLDPVPAARVSARHRTPKPSDAAKVAASRPLLWEAPAPQESAPNTELLHLQRD